MSNDSRPLRPGRVLLVVWALVAMANLVGSVLAFVFFDRIAPQSEVAATPDPSRHAVALTVFLGYIVLMLPAGYLFTRRVIRSDYGWVIEGREPDARERERALGEPFRLAVASSVAWLGGATVFAVLNAAYDAGALGIVRTAIGIAFGGLITSLLTYLLAERAVRPVWAAALRGAAPDRRRYLGVRPRLMLTWAVGSAIPLLGIALAVVGPAHSGDPTTAVVFLVSIGVVGGWLAMYGAARSVSDPLEKVRDAVVRVGEGDLGVSVVVDDGGEVGLLQAGVNRMVAGLRERQRLRDLFGRHVGDEVAAQALARGAGLGGEQREAAALFVDMIGSTSLAADLPPTEVVSVLNRMFSAVVKAAADEGGWVNKFEGDGALCVFGAPADQPDHAARALRAACALGAALAREGIDAGIGVSAGVVVAGNVGSEERYEYTVIGDPVNEAARLCELAKEHAARVLASERAVRAAGAESASGWEAVGQFELRGRGRTTCAYAPAPLHAEL